MQAEAVDPPEPERKAGWTASLPCQASSIGAKSRLCRCLRPALSWMGSSVGPLQKGTCQSSAVQRVMLSAAESAFAPQVTALIQMKAACPSKKEFRTRALLYDFVEHEQCGFDASATLRQPC